MIGIDNVSNNLSLKFRASFDESKWIQIVDSRANRSFAKKYPLLNSSLFTKKKPDGELQGQTLLGKFNTHEYYCSNKAYIGDNEKTGAEKLQAELSAFLRFTDPLNLKTDMKY